MSKLTDEQILGAIKSCPPVKHDYAGWVRDLRLLWGRAIESAATEPLLQRIAELERQLHEQAVSLEEARKQMEAQKDEWLSWEAKRRELEADAGRWREWEQGRGLTVVVPTPTDDKPDRKVTVIYSPNPYSTYPAAFRKAIDAAMRKGQS